MNRYALAWALIFSLLPRMSYQLRWQQMSLRQRRVFKGKLRIVRRIWFVAMGLIMLNPIPAIFLSVCLFTTFLSFAILDEGVE